VASRLSRLSNSLSSFAVNLFYCLGDSTSFSVFAEPIKVSLIPVLLVINIL